MGRRGASYHVRGKHPARVFRRLDIPCLVLASNRSWTSFAPLGDPPAGDVLSRQLAAPVLVIWSDDEVGTSLDFSTPDGWSAELPIPLRSDGVEILQAVEQILTAIWAADDWGAAIRDPELIAPEPLDASQLADWRRRLAT